MRETLERANAAANAISEVAWREQTFGQYALHHLIYHDIRERFDLSAQVVVRVISKVADAYKLDRKVQRVFRPLGSLAYDDRILRYLTDTVSIWTTAGRQRIPFVCGGRQRELLASRQGESDLVYRDGRWYLYVTVNVVEDQTFDPKAFVGVDLGIANIATTGEGTRHSGSHLNRVRHRSRHLRAKLQRKGTKSAKRLLKHRRRKEGRFARDVNHCISKRIVAEAQGTHRGIALEDLEGIRGRVRLRKPQRVTLHSWSFHQLGTFVAYKAERAGVPVVHVDPAYTSQMCSACGAIDEASRPNQATYLCTSCGFAESADVNAARNIAQRGVEGWAAVNRPNARETVETQHHSTRKLSASASSC